MNLEEAGFPITLQTLDCLDRDFEGFLLGQSIGELTDHCGEHLAQFLSEFLFGVCRRNRFGGFVGLRFAGHVVVPLLKGGLTRGWRIHLGHE